MKLRNNRNSASITVEAALGLPIFLFAIMALCYLFVYLRIEYLVQKSLYVSAEEISQYGLVIKPLSDFVDKKIDYAEKQITSNSIIDEITQTFPEISKYNLKNSLYGSADKIIVGELVKRNIPDEVFRHISGENDGLDFTDSVLFDDGECIYISCGYRLKLPFSLFGDLGINVHHELKYRYFTGTKAKPLIELVDEIVPVATPTPAIIPSSIPDITQTPSITDIPTGDVTPTEVPSPTPTEAEEMVLVCETGYVFHRSYNCPSLRISPRQISYENVGNERNDGGGKYYACEHCVRRDSILVDCYITPDGDRYHSKRDCSGLKRTITEVPISQVGKRRECKRCKNMK